jgi:hypothetical protein
MAKRADTKKKNAARRKTKSKKVVKDLDPKRKSGEVKGGAGSCVPIIAVLIGKSSQS